MRLPQEVPENHGVLHYVGEGLDPADVPTAVPSDDVDRLHLGAHPDVVERLWDQLATGPPPSLPYLVAGGPALLDPQTGVIVGIALGTQYALRLAGRSLDDALAAGLETVHTFRSIDRTLDLGATFGPGWVFGGWDRREAAWLAESRAAANL